MKTVTKLSYISHFSENIYIFILHFIFRKHLQFFFVMKALPITFYIDIYVCYIDIYVCYYESLFSLYWHIVRNMSRRMTLWKRLLYMLYAIMKACFHCIGILLEICQGELIFWKRLLYICYIDIYTLLWKLVFIGLAYY